MFKSILKSIINISLIIGILILITINNAINTTFIFRIIILLINIGLYISYNVFRIFGKNKLSRLIYLVYLIYSLGIIIYAILYMVNIIQVLTSVNNLKAYILSTKHSGVLVYIFIQLLQVILLPIPASVICIVGSLIYGPFLGGLYCSIGVLLGSYISFFMGKLFGIKVVTWVVGEENSVKYTKLLKNSGCFFLCIAFLLPMFPDDILCLIAGITNMSFVGFFWVTLITRPIGVICMSYFGSGKIIPFTGWGIYVWILILIFAILVIVLTYKFQSKMQEFVVNKIFKNKRKVKY